MPKVESLAAALHALNPGVKVHCLQQRADDALLDHAVPRASVVLDCSDNYRTRHAINAACVRHRVPLVAAAVIRFDGQLSVFDPRQPDSPCYACLFPPMPSLKRCNAPPWAFLPRWSA
jgi:molybdopterin/thiamine biosynthesis adenylyltransferase